MFFTREEIIFKNCRRNSLYEEIVSNFSTGTRKEKRKKERTIIQVSISFEHLFVIMFLWDKWNTLIHGCFYSRRDFFLK